MKRYQDGDGGNGPAVFAALGNTTIGYHRGNGEPNIARANRRPVDLIDAVTSSNPDYARNSALRA